MRTAIQAANDATSFQSATLDGVGFSLFGYKLDSFDLVGAAGTAKNALNSLLAALEAETQAHPELAMYDFAKSQSNGVLGMDLTLGGAVKGTSDRRGPDNLPGTADDLTPANGNPFGIRVLAFTEPADKTIINSIQNSDIIRRNDAPIIPTSNPLDFLQLSSKFAGTAGIVDAR